MAFIQIMICLGCAQVWQAATHCKHAKLNILNWLWDGKDPVYEPTRCTKCDRFLTAFADCQWLALGINDLVLPVTI